MSMGTYQPKGEDYYMCREVKAERDRLLQRVAELEDENKALVESLREIGPVRKDAERYRWLKAKHNDWYSSWRVYQPDPVLGSVAIDQGLTIDIDDVIDAAMEKDDE